MPTSHKFNISLNLQNYIPENFLIKSDEFEKADIGYNFKNHRSDNELNIKFPFNKNIEDWDIEVLFEDHTWIYGRILIKTLNNIMIDPISSSEFKGEPTNIIQGDIIIGKHITSRLNFRCAWNCYNNFFKSHINFLEKQCSEIVKQIKEKLRIEAQKKIFLNKTI
jgi:hypothetical protein